MAMFQFIDSIDALHHEMSSAQIKSVRVEVNGAERQLGDLVAKLRQTEDGWVIGRTLFPGNHKTQPRS